MLRFSPLQPVELRVSDLPFPQPASDRQRIANALWLIENNPDGRALLPALPDENAAPRFAAAPPSQNEREVAENVLAQMQANDAAAASNASASPDPSAPQMGQVLLAQQQPKSTTVPGQLPPATPAEMMAFLDQHFDLASKTAAKLAVDPTLLLGLSALESGWGRSRIARTLNNPYGQTPDGNTPDKFSSFDEAWEKWGEKYGPRVKDAGSNADEFLERLGLNNERVYGPTIGGDRRRPYNSVNPDWKRDVGNTIGTVRRILPRWLATRGSVP